MKMENKKGYTEEYKEKSGGKEMKRTVQEKKGEKWRKKLDLFFCKCGALKINHACLLQCELPACYTCIYKQDRAYKTGSTRNVAMQHQSFFSRESANSNTTKISGQTG